MGTILLYSYYWIFIIWIPFLIYANNPNLPTSLQKTLRFLVKVSLLAGAYELLMTLFFQSAIRIDILIAILILGLIYTASGAVLVYQGVSGKYTNKLRLTSASLGLLCFSVPVLSIIGWGVFTSESTKVDLSLKNGRHYRFEAAFRNDETQMRFFGQLASQTNPWAGYYLGDNTDSRFKQLIINEQGKFWIYDNELRLLYTGQNSNTPDSLQYQGVAIHGVNDKTHITIEHQGNDAFRLVSQRFINSTVSDTSQKTIFRKISPPRFPEPVSPHDEVKFIGVFSAKTPASSNAYLVTQIWLWQANGKYWGQYLHDLYEKGRQYDFVASRQIEPICSGDCSDMNLTFKTSAGTISISKKSDEMIVVASSGTTQDTLLKRGETVTGFLFDLAPLATSRQNQEWIEAITTGTFVKWLAE